MRTRRTALWCAWQTKEIPPCWLVSMRYIVAYLVYKVNAPAGLVFSYSTEIRQDKANIRLDANSYEMDKMWVDPKRHPPWK
jgi:hypothetical protein